MFKFRFLFAFLFLCCSASALEIDEDYRYIIKPPQLDRVISYEEVVPNPEVFGSQEKWDLGFPLGNSLYDKHELGYLAKASTQDFEQVLKSGVSDERYDMADPWLTFQKKLDIPTECIGDFNMMSKFCLEKLKKQYKDEFFQVLKNAQGELVKLYNLGDVKFKNIIFTDRTFDINSSYDFDNQRLRLELPRVYSNLKISVKDGHSHGIRFELPFDMAAKIAEKGSELVVSYDIDLVQFKEVGIDEILANNGIISSGEHYKIAGIEIAFLPKEFLEKRQAFVECSYGADCKKALSEMNAVKKEIARFKLNKWELCLGHYGDQCIE